MATNIFISYRKEDSKWNTQLLYDRLSKYFSPKSIFKDFNTIKAGEDYRKVIENALSKCHVLLVIIGKNWLNSMDENGKQRLQNPEDLLRIEIETALNRNIRVIPILFDNVSMPSNAQLPETLSSLTLRQSVSVSETNFDYDIRHLAEAIKNKQIEVNPKNRLLDKLIRNRTLLSVAAGTLLAALLTGPLGIKSLSFQCISIAAISLLVSSLLIMSLLKSKIQNKIKSRLQIISISLFLIFIITLVIHVNYFQSNTFLYKGFGDVTTHYIKGSGFTPLGDSLARAHPNMTEADILKKFLGGPGEAQRLWNPASVTLAKMRILYSYTAAIIFFSLFIAVLVELLVMKYKSSPAI